MQITIFPTVLGNEARSHIVTWDQIIIQCKNPIIYSTKQNLPLIKLGSFGSNRTRANSLRSDENMLSISGIEVDYDAEIMSAAEASFLLNMAGIQGVIYTSPSHTPDKPRWRVLAPLSREYLPTERRNLVARLNGIFCGILALESFTSSQTFYFGAVSGVVYECMESSGNFIDLVENLPLIYPVESEKKTFNRDSCPSNVTDETISELEEALEFISSDDRVTWIAVGQDLCNLGETGFRLWDAWSAKSNKYDVRDSEKRWMGFAGDRTDHRAVFAKAQANGWINPKKGKYVVVDPTAVFGGNQVATVGGPNNYMPMHAKLDEGIFPDRSIRFKALGTVDNLEVLMQGYGISCYYDEILKKQVLTFNNGHDFTNDMSNNGKLQELKSLLLKNEIPGETSDRLSVLFMRNQVNPIKQFITSKPWDGVTRLNELYNSVLVSIVDISYRNKALLTWMIQCVAAMDGAVNSPIRTKLPKYEAVLVFQGGQGLFKTSWVRSLLPETFREYIKDGVTLDMNNKDSIKHAISAWLVELGELDSTFKKSDISRLKGFLSMDTDDIRLPYDRGSSAFQRRTSFYGTVNELNFLTDETGSRRFIPLRVLMTNPNHAIDMQQLWAEIWTQYCAGAQWWPDAELLSMLPTKHAEHGQIDPIEDAILSRFDLSTKLINGKVYTCTEILTDCGWIKPSKPDINAVARVLRKHGIDRAHTEKSTGYRLALRPMG